MQWAVSIKNVTSFSKQNITSQKNCWWNDIYRLVWGCWKQRNEKNISSDIRMQKNPQTKKDTSWNLQIFMESWGYNIQLALPHGNFISDLANPEIVYMLLLFQILCIDWLYFFRKNVYFERKFIKYLMELTWVGSNHLKTFWKMDALSS